MAKTSAGFMPKKTTTASKVLPPKLPPRGAMSPAVNSFKSKGLVSNNKKNLLASQNNVTHHAAMKSALDSPMKDNMYFAGAGPVQKNSDSEIVYKRGARSISKKRESSNN